jgi:hypothetical protein
MKFQYKKLASGVSRPIIPITVRNRGTGASVRYFVLVDSGADNCMFGPDIAEVLGIKIGKGRPSTVSGVVARQSRKYYRHDVEIEIGGVWRKTEVGFMPTLSKNGHGFVGRYGFFDRFNFVKFEEAKATVEFGAQLYGK